MVGNAGSNPVPGLMQYTQSQINLIAERMRRIAVTSRIEGASDDQMQLWMRVALYKILNRGEEK